MKESSVQFADILIGDDGRIDYYDRDNPDLHLVAIEPGCEY
jgi:hypothetical protein